MISDVNKPYPLVYMRKSGNERYIIAINPTGKKVEAELAKQGLTNVEYTFGTSGKCTYKPGKSTDTVKLPAVSAAIYKVE